jgi:hypothetical protein
MSEPAGINVPLSLPRRLICDYLHFAKQIPSIPVERHMCLAEVAAARALASPRPSWYALFTKAYAMTTMAYPQLRRAYLAFPRPRFYEHPISVASLAIERRLGDEDAVLFFPLRRPDTRALVDIEARLTWMKEEPIECFGSFRRLLAITRLPRPLRRALWWAALNTFGRKRAHFMGTFGVSAYSSLGAASLHPLSLLTTTLNYGVIGADGGVGVRITYDHRVMDGSTVARALADLERILRHEIVAELRYLESTEAA